MYFIYYPTWQPALKLIDYQIVLWKNNEKSNNINQKVREKLYKNSIVHI